MHRKTQYFFCGFIFTCLACGFALVESPLAIAKPAKKVEKKDKADSSASKAAFKKWFDGFFSRLYYAKDLSEVRPYYSSRFMRGYHKIPDHLRETQLKKLKKAYIGKPKIQKVIMHPGNKSCDVKIEGNVSVYKHRGYGYGIFRMIKEDDIWRIDSAAHRGKAFVHR